MSEYMWFIFLPLAINIYKNGFPKGSELRNSWRKTESMHKIFIGGDGTWLGATGEGGGGGGAQ